ncbi:MAG TPA: anaerobic glycerol-3-phosphate dehydrogenase subunit C [Chloroflexota bacterium]
MSVADFPAFEAHRIELSTDACIKCNVCQSYCPVSNVTDLFPGPKYVGPQAQRLRIGPSVDHSVDYCSGCTVCTRVCPSGVRIAELNSRARAAMVRARGGPSLRDRLIARPELMGQLSRPFAPLVNYTLQNRLFRLALQAVLRIDARSPMPTFSRRSFRAWHRRYPYRSDRKVAYFYACSTEYYEPELGEKAVKVLERNGYQTLLPPQNCCGLPLISNGDYAAARTYAQRNIRRLLPMARAGIPIVATSTSCSLTLKQYYRDLLDIRTEEADLVASNVFDICEFLRILYERGQMNLDFGEVDLEVAYHAPCQLKSHGIGRPALDLMELVPGLLPIEMDAECCGTAGTYGYKREKYDIAMKVGETLFEQIADTGAPVSSCDSETCRWQIEHGTHRPSLHPIEILLQGYEGKA